MSYRSIVLVKQVPDPKRVTGQAMTEEGTVNRAALPPIFNPEDLHALEAALGVKDRYGGTVTVLTMGPPPAAQVLRDALYRGADAVALITDRRFAASDTLATSYILTRAIRRVGDFDLVWCGRQAIDGDTAQVGPQTAEKLGVPQITYVEGLLGLEDGVITVRRAIEGGYEVVRCPLPVLLTITDAASVPRPPNAKRLMQFKRATTATEVRTRVGREIQQADDDLADVDKIAAERVESLKARNLLIPEWNVEDIGADPERCGSAGSPTLVHQVEKVVLTSPEYREVLPTEGGLRGLFEELIQDHTLEA
jgi:electron transfer flavoprotein beta subunit